MNLSVCVQKVNLFKNRNRKKEKKNEMKCVKLILPKDGKVILYRAIGSTECKTGSSFMVSSFTTILI